MKNNSQTSSESVGGTNGGSIIAQQQDVSSSNMVSSSTTTQSDTNSLLGVLALTSIEQSEVGDDEKGFDQPTSSSLVLDNNNKTRVTTSTSNTSGYLSSSTDETSPLFLSNPSNPSNPLNPPTQPIKTIASDQSLLETISNIVPAVHLTNLSNNTPIEEPMEPAHSPRRSTRKKTPKKHFSPEPIASSSTVDEGNDPMDLQDVSYLFGPPWSQDELISFLVAYNQHKNDWERIKEVLPNRSTQMIQGLYEVHKRFIELDCTIDVKKLQFYEIHQDYIHNSVPPLVASRTKNSAKKRTNEFSETTSPSKKKLGSPSRQRFAKSPKNSNSKTIPLSSTPPTLTHSFQTNVKRKQKIIFEPLPAEFIESSVSAPGESENTSLQQPLITTTATTGALSLHSNTMTTLNHFGNNNPPPIACSSSSSQEQAPPSSPTTTMTISTCSAVTSVLNAPSNLQSPLSPTASSSDLASLGMLSPDSKKNYEKNKKLPIKLRKKGTHGNPLLKHVQMISGDQNDTDLVEAAQNSGVKMYKILARKKTRAFCASEWFYPTIDFGFYDKNEFIECLASLDEPYRNRKIFKKSELKGLRTEMCKRFGKPRRLSPAFLKQERAKLELYRGFARDYYQHYKQVYQVSHQKATSSDDGGGGDGSTPAMDASSFSPPPVIMDTPLTLELPFVDQLPYPFKKNEQVLVLHPETLYVQLATIMDDTQVSKTDYKVRFNYSKEERIVQDTDIMQIGTVSLLPVQKRELIVSNLQMSSSSQVLLPQQLVVAHGTHPYASSSYLNTSFSSMVQASSSSTLHSSGKPTLHSTLPPQTPPRKQDLTNFSFLSSGGDTLMNTSLLSSSPPPQHSPFHNLFQSPSHERSTTCHDSHASLQSSSSTAALQQTPNNKKQSNLATSTLLSPNHLFSSSPLIGGTGSSEENQDFIMMTASPPPSQQQASSSSAMNLISTDGTLSIPPLITPGMVDLNHASPEVIRNIAKCIVLLRKKHELVKNFKQKNDRARMLLLVHQEQNVFDREFCIDYTKIVLDLKQVNTELELLLPLMRAYCSTPSYATTNYPINKIFSQSISKQASIIADKFGNNQLFQDIFELNREHAKEIVNTISSQILKQFPMEGSRLNSPSSSFSQTAINQNFTEKIYNCIALLLHLRSCCMNPGVFKDSEIDLFIEAGLMALQDQPSAISSNNNGSNSSSTGGGGSTRSEMREIFVFLKEHFLKQPSSPHSSSIIMHPQAYPHSHHHVPSVPNSSLPLLVSSNASLSISQQQHLMNYPYAPSHYQYHQ